MSSDQWGLQCPRPPRSWQGWGWGVGQGENLSGGVRSGDQTGFPRLCSLRGVARVLHQQQLGALIRRHDSSPIPGPAGLAQQGRSELAGGQDGAWCGVRVETVASPCPAHFVHTPRPQCCLPSRVTAVLSSPGLCSLACKAGPWASLLSQHSRS